MSLSFLAPRQGALAPPSVPPNKKGLGPAPRGCEPLFSPAPIQKGGASPTGVLSSSLVPPLGAGCLGRGGGSRPLAQPLQGKVQAPTRVNKSLPPVNPCRAMDSAVQPLDEAGGRMGAALWLRPHTKRHPPRLPSPASTWKGLGLGPAPRGHTLTGKFSRPHATSCCSLRAADSSSAAAIPKERSSTASADINSLTPPTNLTVLGLRRGGCWELGIPLPHFLMGVVVFVFHKRQVRAIVGMLLVWIPLF